MEGQQKIQTLGVPVPDNQRRRPDSLLCAPNQSKLLPTDSPKPKKSSSLASAEVDENNGAVKVNVQLPTPIPAKHGLSIAHVAYPFKNSADGKIEQFIHTPTTPDSDPRHPQGPHTCALVNSGEDKTMPLPSKLSISSKAFDLSKLTGLKITQQKSSDSASGDSERSTPASLTLPSVEKQDDFRKRLLKAESHGHIKLRTADSTPLHRRVDSLRKKRPSLKDLLKGTDTTPQSISLTSLQRKGTRSLLPSIHAIDSHSLKQFENFLDKGLESRKQSLRYFTKEPTLRQAGATLSPLATVQDDEKKISRRPDFKPREKFKYCIRMIRFMIRLYMCLKLYARNKDGNQQSIEQLNYYSMETEFTTQKLVFSKGNFAASNVLCVPLRLRIMLSIPPHERASRDVTRMAMLLRTYYAFKDSMDKEKLEELCRYSSYSRYEKQRIIIRSGHRSVFTYLLLSGSVFVNIEEKNKANGKKFIRTATVLKKGSLFGEIGVIHRIPRTATIVTRESVECLVIDPEACLRIFPEAISKEFERRLKHMMMSDLFNGWPQKTLNNLCLVSKLLQYSYGVLIDKDSATSEFIYMVTSGRLEVMYRLHVPAQEKTTTSEDTDAVVTLSDLLQRPPNHEFLPPLPAPSPPLLCNAESMAALRKKEGVLMSLDNIYPHQCIDLLCLAKGSHSMPLVLVSRGCEVIRFPKLHLQTIPPPKYFRNLMDQAKRTPSYPPDHVLTQLYLEHFQWASYRKLVLQDVLGSKECFQPVPVPRRKGRTKSVSPPRNAFRVVDEHTVAMERKFQKCLSYQEPLYDLDKHKHKGPCLRDWMNKSFKASARVSLS